MNPTRPGEIRNQARVDPARALDEPIFIVGAQRSGTTLLRLMLDHNPLIDCFGEFEYAVDLVPDGGGWPSVAAYRGWLETERRFQDHGFAIDDRLSYPELVRGFLHQRQRRSGKPVVAAVVHRHFDRLLRIWPGARFVHMVRDGRDVARSCIRMGWAGNVWTGAERWIEAELLWRRMVERLNPSRRAEVRYENLLSDPEGELHRLCEFVGVGYDAAMLRYHVDSTYERLDPSHTAQWRKRLSGREVRLVESRIGPMLRERGYELSGLPASRPSGLRRALLRVQDRLARVRNRIGRYGVLLWGGDVVVRRLGLEGLERRIRVRCNAIDRAYLQ